METTEQKVNRFFWPPSVTSQFRICPIPFHFDTYRGCSYGCLFCFARDFIEFSRRNRDEGERRQSYLEGNDPKGLKKWIEKVKAMDYDYSKAATVAFKERIVVKIGATADPFPIIEKSERITYECLKVFGEEDYPVQISTKNPEVFLEYADEFIGSNIALNVSCSFLDDDTARQIECSAISPTRRFEAIRKLSDMGFMVTVRMQPFILPYSEEVADRFIAKLKEIGAWAYQTEGLKLRIAMSDKEKAVYKKIGDVLGFDIIRDFKVRGSKEGGDMVYSEDDKRRMLQLLQDLSLKYGVRFYNADNLVESRYGCGSECCGTEFLRNHKIWGGCARSLVFEDSGEKCSEEFGKCLVNFTRSQGNATRTIADVTQDYLRDERIREDLKRYVQLSLF